MLNNNVNKNIFVCLKINLCRIIIENLGRIVNFNLIDIDIGIIILSIIKRQMQNLYRYQIWIFNG